MLTVNLKPGQLTLSDLRPIRDHAVRLSLDPACIDAIGRSVDTVAALIGAGEAIYGVNTGFGLLARTRIPTGELEQLQRAIVLSHAAGTGAVMAEWPGAIPASGSR